MHANVQCATYQPLLQSPAEAAPQQINMHLLCYKEQKKIIPALTDHQSSQTFALLGKSPRKTATQIMSLEARARQETIQLQSQYVAVHGMRKFLIVLTTLKGIVKEPLLELRTQDRSQALTQQTVARVDKCTQEYRNAQLRGWQYPQQLF